MTNRRALTAGPPAGRFTALYALLQKLFYDGPGLPGVFFAVGALSFGVGTIVMANVLAPADLGVVMLFLVFLRLGIALGPFGLDVQLLRARPSQDVVPFGAILPTSILTTLFSVAVITVLYELPLQLLLALSVGLIGATCWRMFVVLNQARGRKKKALTLSQAPNIIALVLGLTAWLGGIRSPNTLCMLGAAGYVSAALIGWKLSHAENWAAADRQPDDWKLADRFGLAGLAIMALLLGQIERFLIPEALTLEDLALYSAVASLAVAPLKLLSSVSKFYLIPFATGARNPTELVDVIRYQGMALAGLALLSCVAVLVISPWLWDRILPETYVIENALVLAVLAVGLVRLYVAIANTLLQAGGSTRALFMSNIGVLFCLGLASVLASTMSAGKLTTMIWILVGGIACYGLTATVLVAGVIRNKRSSHAGVHQGPPHDR